MFAYKRTNINNNSNNKTKNFSNFIIETNSLNDSYLKECNRVLKINKISSIYFNSADVHIMRQAWFYVRLKFKKINNKVAQYVSFGEIYVRCS